MQIGYNKVKMVKGEKRKRRNEVLEGRCTIFNDGYYFAFKDCLISCETLKTGRINFELAEINNKFDITKFGFSVKVRAGLLRDIYGLLCLSSKFGPDNFYTALNQKIDAFYRTMMRQIYYDSTDRRRWNAGLSAFSHVAAKEFKADFFDFTGENEVRRSTGLAGKTD